MSADQLPLVLVAGITFFLSHHLLLSAALGLDGEMSVWSCFRHDFLFHGGIHAVLLALSPTVVATASHSLVFMPLLLLPIATIHRAARISLAREHEACHDSLTGLPNRILFREKVEFALKESRRRHSKFAVMIVDLDGFKEVNDSLGHHNGDALLQNVASSLSRFLGPDTVVARLGGDEFGVLITSVSDDGDADRRARRLRDALHSPYNTPGGVVDIDASIGVAVHPDHGDDYSVLMQRADVAMYPVAAEVRSTRPSATRTPRDASGSWATSAAASRPKSSFSTTSPRCASATVAFSVSRRCCGGTTRATAL